MDLKTEKYYWKKGYKNIVGLDEAGRGPLAGPVAAAAVMIKMQPKKNSKITSWKTPQQIKTKHSQSSFLEIILKKAKDSKKLSASQREQIFSLLQQTPVIKYSYALINEKIIDKINIEQATFLAMRKCLQKLKITPDLLLIDGNRPLPQISIPQKTIIKGDNKVASIALASIIAKVIRDKKMLSLAKKYPYYHFEIHKGYPTALHRQLLKKYGPCPLHRKSYQPVQAIIRNSKQK